MKKLNMLLVVAILVTALIAQALPAKLIRLEVYNWTGENVYIRLEGITTGQFYYLTVPPTTRANWYQPKVYTIITDYYRRTTWACGGVQTTGQLRIVKNFRMNFTACNTLPLRTVWYDLSQGGAVSADELFKVPNFGEPTMEKVVYFQVVTNKVWVKFSPGVDLFPNDGDPFPKNIWFLTVWGDPTGNEGYGVPFELQEFCSPNNCYYRITPWGGAFGLPGIFYGPALNNRFRYRY